MPTAVAVKGWKVAYIYLRCRLDVRSAPFAQVRTNKVGHSSDHGGQTNRPNQNKKDCGKRELVNHNEQAGTDHVTETSVHVADKVYTTRHTYK